MAIKTYLPKSNIVDKDIRVMEHRILSDTFRLINEYPASSTLRNGDVKGDFSISTDGNTIAMCTGTKWIFLT